jgi:hypothetical protein
MIASKTGLEHAKTRAATLKQRWESTVTAREKAERASALSASALREVKNNLERLRGSVAAAKARQAEARATMAGRIPATPSEASEPSACTEPGAAGLVECTPAPPAARFDLNKTPLLNFRSYRLHPDFRADQLRSSTWSHRLDTAPDAAPLCRFELMPNGACNDPACTAQHLREIEPRQEELVQELRAYSGEHAAETGGEDQQYDGDGAVLAAIAAARRAAVERSKGGGGTAHVVMMRTKRAVATRSNTGEEGQQRGAQAVPTARTDGEDAGGGGRAAPRPARESSDEGSESESSDDGSWLTATRQEPGPDLFTEQGDFIGMPPAKRQKQKLTAAEAADVTDDL